MNLEFIKEKVLKVYEKCDIHTFPIDCFSILHCYKIQVFTYEEAKEHNTDLYIAIKNYSKDAIRFKSTVYYNSSNSIGRIRFSLMHELGHIVLDHQGESQDNEDEADYFASYMLAPRVAIAVQNCKTADDIHDTFGLSYAAANKTLFDYKKWSQVEQSQIDNDLKTLIYYPKAFKIMENHRKNKERERRKTQKKMKFYEERRKWLEENVPDYNELIWQAHDRTFY